jgi:single-strand DNA-binding protein
MSRINLAILAGNLVRDPELKYLPDGTACCEFTIAHNEVWTTNGEKKEHVNFINCTAFGKRGETINEWFQKGKLIQVQGSMKFSSWESKEGEKRSALKINVMDFDFIGAKGESSNNAGASEPSFPQPNVDVNEEEIPF